jgi:putative DNA primase/helicase
MIPHDQHKAFIKFAADSEKAGTIDATLKLAQAKLAVTPDELDRSDWLLNVANGTIDLRTGKSRPHDPADRITKIAPVEWHGLHIESPKWDQFLARILPDADTRQYLQRKAGIWLTGDIGVQEFDIPYGGGANGKSVFFDTLLGMLGDYAGRAPESLLTARKHDEHPTEIADLFGKRLIVGSETEEGAKLRLQLIKRLTGDETMKGRFMRRDYFEFRRTAKVVLVTNNRPAVGESSDAVWRRLRLIPFNVTIPPEERDPALMRKLREEWPGILAWAVMGCLDWQRHGLNTPGDVMAATEGYHADQDELSEYLADRCIRSSATRVPRNDLYQDFQSYCAMQSIRDPLTRNTFFDRIRRLPSVNELQTRIGGIPTRIFTGIGLSATAQQGATGASV